MLTTTLPLMLSADQCVHMVDQLKAGDLVKVSWKFPLDTDYKVWHGKILRSADARRRGAHRLAIIRFQEDPDEYAIPMVGKFGAEQVLHYSVIEKTGEGLSPVAHRGPIQDDESSTDVTEEIHAAELQEYIRDQAPVHAVPDPVPEPVSVNHPPGSSRITTPTVAPVIIRPVPNTPDDPDDPMFYNDPAHWAWYFVTEYRRTRWFELMQERYLHVLKESSDRYTMYDVIKALRDELLCLQEFPNLCNNPQWLKGKQRLMKRLNLNRIKSLGAPIETIKALQRTLDEEGRPAYMQEFMDAADKERKLMKKSSIAKSNY